METSQLPFKKYAFVALAALFALVLGAIVYYKERLFADTSYIAFIIINYKAVAIQNQRWGSFITQMVPYLGQKFHLPLKVILLSYSISFNLFFLLVAALITWRYKQYKLVVLMAFFYLLLVSDSYFLENDELQQGVAWLFWLYAVILHQKQPLSNFLVFSASFIVLAFLSLSSHFVVIIPFVFLWVYLMIEKRNWPFSGKRSLMLAGLLIPVVALKFFFSQGSQYESDHLYGITHFSLQDIIDAFIKPEVTRFMYRSLTNYWWGIIVFVLGLWSLIKNREIKLFTWSLLSCLGYIILMGLTYTEWNSNVSLCHIELEWQSLGIIISAPFVFSFLPRLKPRAGVALLSVIFITRFIYLGVSATIFADRIKLQETILSQMRKKHISKLALFIDPIVTQKYIMIWTAPYESLFSSATAGDDPQLTFCFVNKDDKQTRSMLADNPTCFDNVFGMLAPGDMNAHYFSIDTSRPYREMTYEELFK